MSVHGNVIQQAASVNPAALGPDWMRTFQKYLGQAHAAGVTAATLAGWYANGDPAENKTGETSTAISPAIAPSNAVDHATAHEPSINHKWSQSLQQPQHSSTVPKPSALPVIPETQQNSSLPLSKSTVTDQTSPVNGNGADAQAIAPPTTDGDSSATHPVHILLKQIMKYAKVSSAQKTLPTITPPAVEPIALPPMNLKVYVPKLDLVHKLDNLPIATLHPLHAQPMDSPNRIAAPVLPTPPITATANEPSTVPPTNLKTSIADEDDNSAPNHQFCSHSAIDPVKLQIAASSQLLSPQTPTAVEATTTMGTNPIHTVLRAKAVAAPVVTYSNPYYVITNLFLGIQPKISKINSIFNLFQGRFIPYLW